MFMILMNFVVHKLNFKCDYKKKIANVFLIFLNWHHNPTYEEPYKLNCIAFWSVKTNKYLKFKMWKNNSNRVKISSYYKGNFKWKISENVFTYTSYIRIYAIYAFTYSFLSYINKIHFFDHEFIIYKFFVFILFVH